GDPAGNPRHPRALGRGGAAHARGGRPPDRASRYSLAPLEMKSAALAVLLLAAQASAAPGKLTYSGKAMGTSVSLWFWTDKQEDAAKAAEAVFAEMKRLDEELTTWTREGTPSTSDVVKINLAAGVKPVAVSDETLAVIERALDISKPSNGIFDITVQ